MAENKTVSQRLKPHAGRFVAALGLLAIGLVAGLGLAQFPLKASSTPAGSAGQTTTTAAAGKADLVGSSGHRRAGRVGLPQMPLKTSSAPDGGTTPSTMTAAVGRGGAAEHAAWLASRPAAQTTTAVGRGGAAEHAAWLAAHPAQLGP